MRQSLWVIYHVAGALVVLGVVAVAWLLTRRFSSPVWTWLRRGIAIVAMVFCTGALIWLVMQTVDAAWRVTSTIADDPFSVEVGEFVRANLPDNAVLLCEETKGYEHLTTMFYADRTCYPLGGRGPDDMARQIVQAGGVPYVVTRRNLPLAPVYVSRSRGPTIYLWRPD